MRKAGIDMPMWVEDPINRIDPTGQLWEITCGGFGDGDGDASDDCGGDLPNEGWGCNSVYIMAAFENMQMPSPCTFLIPHRNLSTSMHNDRLFRKEGRFWAFQCA